MNDFVIVRGQKIALTSIFSWVDEHKKGKPRQQKVNIVKLLSGGKTLTSRQIHSLMAEPPRDISSTRRAITYLVEDGILISPYQQRCQYTQKLVKVYRINDNVKQLKARREKPIKTEEFLVIRKKDDDSIIAFGIYRAEDKKHAVTGWLAMVGLSTDERPNCEAIPKSHLKHGYHFQTKIAMDLLGDQPVQTRMF